MRYVCSCSTLYLVQGEQIYTVHSIEGGRGKVFLYGCDRLFDPVLDRTLTMHALLRDLAVPQSSTSLARAMRLEKLVLCGLTSV